MDTNVLELFSLVVRHGSFAAAARDHNVDPSSISRSIATLEAELGVRLFQRNTRKLTLTEAGHIYLQRIEPLIDELKHAHDAAIDVSSQIKGTLRVTASNSFGLTCVVPTLPAFSARYPGLTVDLMLTDTVVDLLTERIDLAIRLGPLSSSNLIAQLLTPTRYRVVANAAYLRKRGVPKKPANLADHACLVFPLAGFRSRWIFRKDGVLTKVPITGMVLMSSAIGLQHCALEGMGMALLPSWLVDNDIWSGKLVHVLPKWDVTATDFNTAAWFVYPSRSYVPSKVRVFMEFLRAHINAPSRRR